MAVISLSLDDEHASLFLRERVALNDETIPKVLRALIAHRNIAAAVVASTCLRTMVVVESERFHGAIDEITETLSSVTGVPVEEFHDALTIHFDRGVAHHLFSVAAGLRSVVPGEYEILGQLRRALDVALEEHSASPALAELFQRAIASGRRVRNETTIARGTTSFAHAAVEAALAHAPVSAHRAVVVGAGQLATGIVRSLLASAAVDDVVVLNRTLERAEALRAQTSDHRVRVDSLRDVDQHLQSASLVFVAAAVATPIISPAQLADGKRRVLVDLAVPHGVARDVDALDHVRRMDIATLKQRIDQALDERRDAVTAAEDIVRHDVEKFADDQRARGAAALVTQLREQFDVVVTSELQRRMGELEQLPEADQDLVRSIVRSVVAKLAHRPTTVLKESAGTDQGVRLSEATRALFDLR